MAASVERLRETLQHEVGILNANFQGVESRVELLEMLSQQTPEGPVSQGLLQQSPRCATEAAVESCWRWPCAAQRHTHCGPQSCCPGPVSSSSVASAQPQGAGSPRPVTPSTYRSALPQERQDLDGLQRRLVGKVSGIVSVLNKSCEARSCQHGSRTGNSRAESGHAAAVLSRMSR